jgi:hypothetical protein
VWHHTSLSPDGKLLLRTTGGAQPDKNNLPRAAFLLWDLTSGKELPAIETAVAPATNVYWCGPRRFLTIHGYQKQEGGGRKTFSHEMIDADAGAVVASYGPPKGYEAPRVGLRKSDGLAGDPAGRVWVNLGGSAASTAGPRGRGLWKKDKGAAVNEPGIPGGAWRPTAFPTPGADAALAQGGADLFTLRPGVTIRAELDLGEREASKNAAEALAGRLQQAGYAIGPNAWALRVRATKFDSDQKLTSGPADTGGVPIPAAKLTWELLTPAGSVAWSGTTETKWIFGGSKFKTKQTSSSFGPGFKNSVVTRHFDFKGQPAGVAIWDEILERITAEMAVPPAMPRALLGAGGQSIALPLQAEFTVPAN